MRRPIVLVALFSVAVAGAQEEPPPALVVTSSVTAESLAESIELPGTVRPVRDSLVASEVDGRVASREVDGGERVRRGEVLARLDTTRLENDRDIARADKAEAEAQLALARRQEARAVELHRDSVLSDRDLDEAVSRREALEARIASLAARIANIEGDISRATIRAPFGGLVTEVHCEMGEWVAQGDPVVRLSSLETLEIVVEVPERYFPALSTGQATPATVDALPEVRLDGRIHALVPRADAEARAFPVIVRAPNPRGRVGAGMLARVRLDLGSGRTALLVPKDAIVRQAQQEMVFLVEGDQVRAVTVRTGRAVGSRVEVTGDLQAGQSVVVKGNERLMPGQKVRVEEARASATAGS
jgi:RND family efflux transporter MFP subunit